MSHFRSKEEGGGNAPDLSWQQDEEQIFRIYHLARYLWPIKDDQKDDDTILWGEWFKEHTGMTLEEFVEWSNENHLREKFRHVKHIKHRMVVTQKENIIGRKK